MGNQKKRMGNLLAASLIAGCVFCSAPTVCFASGDDITISTPDFEKTELKAKLSQFESEKTELSDRVSQLEAEKATLSQRVTELETENQKLQEDNERLQAALNGETETELPENETEETEDGQPGPGGKSANGEYHDKAIVKLVQEALNGMGYDCGTPDGLAGYKTVTAITAYQRENGLNTDGIVTDALLASLNLTETVEKLLQMETAKADYSEEYTYEQLARTPESYIGYKVKFSGSVLQVSEGNTCYLRLAVNGDPQKVIFVTYDKNENGYRLLENDYIAVYGMAFSTYSYETAENGTITLPWVMADIIELY